MWRSKKFIVVAVLAAVILVGSVSGLVLAADNGDDSQTNTLLDRVAAVLVGKGVDVTSEQLSDAFTQAKSEMRTEALQNRLQYLVGQDKMTQDEADQYFEWWQSKPEGLTGFGFRGHGGFRGMGGSHGWGGPYAPAQ